MTRDLDGRVGTDVDHVIFDENKGRELLGIKPALPQKRSPRSRLRRGEPNQMVALVGRIKWTP